MKPPKRALWLPKHLIFDQFALQTLFTLNKPSEEFEVFCQMVRNLAPEDVQQTLLPWIANDYNIDIAQYFPHDDLKWRALSRLLTASDVKDIWHFRKEHLHENRRLKDFTDALAGADENQFSLLLADVSDCQISQYAYVASRVRTILSTREAERVTSTAVANLQAANGILSLINPESLNIPFLLPAKEQVKEFRHQHRCYKSISEHQTWIEIECYLDDVRRFALELGLDVSQARIESTEALKEHTAIRDWLRNTHNGATEPNNHKRKRDSLSASPNNTPLLTSHKRIKLDRPQAHAKSQKHIQKSRQREETPSLQTRIMAAWDTQSSETNRIQQNNHQNVNNSETKRHTANDNSLISKEFAPNLIFRDMAEGRQIDNLVAEIPERETSIIAYGEIEEAAFKYNSNQDRQRTPEISSTSSSPLQMQTAPTSPRSAKSNAMSDAESNQSNLSSSSKKSASSVSLGLIRISNEYPEQTYTDSIKSIRNDSTNDDSTDVDSTTSSDSRATGSVASADDESDEESSTSASSDVSDNEKHEERPADISIQSSRRSSVSSNDGDTESNADSDSNSDDESGKSADRPNLMTKRISPKSKAPGYSSTSSSQSVPSDSGSIQSKASKVSSEKRLYRQSNGKASSNGQSMSNSRQTIIAPSIPENRDSYDDSSSEDSSGDSDFQTPMILRRNSAELRELKKWEVKDLMMPHW
jgi:hypothetical protein